MGGIHVERNERAVRQADGHRDASVYVCHDGPHTKCGAVAGVATGAVLQHVSLLAPSGLRGGEGSADLYG